MRTAKTLIRLGGCPGWSDSSLGAHSLCCFCHVAAHFTTLPHGAGEGLQSLIVALLGRLFIVFFAEVLGLAVFV